jgi:Transposase DDE domain
VRPDSDLVVAPAGFQAAFGECLGAICPALPKRRGRRPRVPLAKVLPALVFHFMNAAGTFAEHFAQLFEDSLADSSLSERRARLPWEVFTELMRLGLRTLAQAPTHPEAFWRVWRLVALDGTQFSLTNTPQVKARARKAKSRRGRAAFAKLTTGVLLELGLHNPLAAAIGRGGQSEWVLALELLAQVPAQALLLADRLHGCAAFVAAAWAACEKVGSHFLIRARTNIKVQVVKRFKDGSRLVRVPVRQKGKPRVIVQWLELREIRVRVQRPGHRAQELRLWTSLLDPKSAPAQELIELYARRWEHELYYRELKRQLRKSDVLQSHTVETGAQEIAAVVLASALLARARARAAAGAAPVLRVSFVKLLELMRPLWLTLALGGDLLSARQKQQLTERFLERAGQLVTRRRRRPRSCPRAVRQPVSAWPRLRRNQSWEGPVRFTHL